MSRREGWAERFLRWAVDDEEAAEGLLGDLAEDSGARGPSTVACVGLGLRYLFARLSVPRPGEVTRSLRLTARSLFRHPTYSATVGLTLALGLGAVGAVFAVVHAVLLAPLPYPDADRLVRLESAVPGLAPDERWNLAKAQYLDLTENASTFEELGLYVFSVMTVGPSADGGAATRARIAYVDPGLFETLAVEPALGRRFSPQESLDNARLILLSDGYWRRATGADPNVVGTTVLLDGAPREVIGVLPPGVRLPEEESSPSDGVEMWLPLQVDPAEVPRNNHIWRSLARLSPGATVGAANAELERLSARLPDLFPEAYDEEFMRDFGFRAVATPLHEWLVGDIEATLWIVFGSVGLLLLVACFNAANLHLARGERRRREVAIRSALGASRGTLSRQLLLESLVLSVASAVVALGLASVLVQWLTAAAPDGLPRLAHVGIGMGEAAFVMGTALAIGILFGVSPILRPGANPLAVVGRTASASQGGHGLRNSLVVGQIAVSLVLLAGASLLLRSFQKLQAVESGVAEDHVLTFEVILPFDEYGTYEAAAEYYRQATQALEALPGVARAGTASALPFTGYDGCSSVVGEGGPGDQDGSTPPCLPVVLVGPGFFEAMGMSVRGEPVGWDEIGTRTVVAAASESLARRLWPGEEPIGRGVSGFGAPMTPVGAVVGDVRGAGLDRPAWDALYLSFLPHEGYGNWAVPRFLSFAVRANEGVEPRTLIPTVRTTLEALDPRVPVVGTRPLAELVAASNARRVFVARVLGLAALMSVLLSGLGVYAVISYIVQGRRAEIGVRIALGAHRSGVRRMVVRQAVVLAILGVGVGLLTSLPLSSLLAGLLFEVQPTDPLTLSAVSALLVVVTALAAFEPSVRATRVDPVEALRGD